MKLFFAIIIAMNSAFILTDGAEFSFLEGTSHTFEDTNAGDIIQHTYNFTNSGDAPLVISDYNVACTCTKLKYPKEPILPGEAGQLELSFDTNGKYGFQKRKVEIFSNATKSVSLLFKVNVIPYNE